MKAVSDTLRKLEASGNLRTLPASGGEGVIDLSSNDYLGLAADRSLRREFLETLTEDSFLPTSSASRLLAGSQEAYAGLENFLAGLYGAPALLFNSGYHANTGMVAALGGKDTLFVADKLVHASIIDGLTLSGSEFRRFRHNDMAHLEKILTDCGSRYGRVVIIAESVYSMDGDRADIDALVRAKRLHSNVLLYVDEAHAVGVLGEQGLGLAAHNPGVDILVGTLGKALASAGAYAVMNDTLRRFMVNRCRSLIFSTALPPVQAAWTEFVMRRAVLMDDRRRRLADIAGRIGEALGKEPSHIMPFIVGDAARTVELSRQLLRDGVKVLPIRTPTVPPGTERLRISLSAALTDAETDKAIAAFKGLDKKISLASST